MEKRLKTIIAIESIVIGILVASIVFLAISYDISEEKINIDYEKFPEKYYENDPVFLKKENEILHLEIEKLYDAILHADSELVAKENLYEKLEKDNNILRKEIELHRKEIDLYRQSDK